MELSNRKKNSITNKNTLYWIFAIIIAVIATVFITGFYRKNFDRFDINHVSANESFEFSDTLKCNVVYSTFEPIHESSFEFLEIPEFTLYNLTSGEAIMKFGDWQYNLEKTQEGNLSITYITKSIEGLRDDSVQTIQIMKDTGTFVRTFMGQGQYFGGREKYYQDMFQYVVTQKGWCE